MSYTPRSFITLRSCVLTSAFSSKVNDTTIIFTQIILKEYKIAGSNSFVLYDPDNESKWLEFRLNDIGSKREWLCHLIRLQLRTRYDRMIDDVMVKEDLKVPLNLPTSQEYVFILNFSVSMLPFLYKLKIN